MNSNNNSEGDNACIDSVSGQHGFHPENHIKKRFDVYKAPTSSFIQVAGGFNLKQRNILNYRKIPIISL